MSRRLALALLLLLALGAPPARAQGQVGIWYDIRPRPAVSWWAWPGCAQAPVLVVEGGEGGASCQEGIALVWAQGDYQLIVADGVVLFRGYRAYLPNVTTTRPEGP